MIRTDPGTTHMETAHLPNVVPTQVNGQQRATGGDGGDDSGRPGVSEPTPGHIQPPQTNQDAGHVPPDRPDAEGKQCQGGGSTPVHYHILSARHTPPSPRLRVCDHIQQCLQHV